MVKRHPLPSVERLNELFAYDPEKGILIAKTDRTSKRCPYKAGDQVGYVNSNGYVIVTVDGRLRMLHRVVWKMCTGTEPTEYLDHINRNKIDNRIENLRLASARENGVNAGLSRANNWGTKGVAPTRDGWRAVIRIGDKTEFLGSFKTLDGAAEAYEKRHREIHGEFSPDMPKAYDVVLLTDEKLVEDVADVRRKLLRMREAANKAGQTKFHDALHELTLDLADVLTRASPEKYKNYQKRGED